MEPNPTYLPPQFEVRKLGPEHVKWACAIITHSNIFCSPVWPAIYPDNQIARAYGCFEAADYLVRAQIESGLSYGVFDRQYQFKRTTSAASGGAIYWDASKVDTSKEELLAQMDFPLVSIALGYDGVDELDHDRIEPLIATIPVFATVYEVLAARDVRDPASWKATAAGQVLLRNGTATRQEYEGLGLMKMMAHWLMHHMAEKGFRGIQIECFHDAVTKVWMTPPQPFKATLVSSLDGQTYEEEVDGKKVHPFSPSTQIFTKIYVALES